MKNDLAIGVDIGGTHITAALFDKNNKQLLLDTMLRAHINTHLEEEAIYQQWASAIKPLLVHTHQIGIAMPGPFDYEQGISLMNGQDKYDLIYQKDIKKGFAEYLGILPENILFMNDAACFLKGEMVGGAGKEFQNAVGITLGTGLGSTYYRLGQAFDADMWNISYQDSIAEHYISSRWFTRRYEQLTQASIANVKSIVDLGDEHPVVLQLFDEFATHLSFFIHELYQKHGADAVIIGGSINKAHRLFLEQTHTRLIDKYSIDLPLLVAELSENAALVGAASQWQ